jgi:predicted transport protein
MKSAIFMNGRKFDESEFISEEAFEKIVKEHFKTLFGQKTVYFDIKSKIDSKALGSAIPDAFLFDFKDEDSPDFYVVEVELQRHDFYKHIFPQITKFLAFFNNSVSRTQLVERLFSYVKSNSEIEIEFKKYLRGKEIYKALRDIIEGSQNILLVIDDVKSELQEVSETYTDTWGKMVKVEILKQYTADKQAIFTMNPDFEEIDLPETPPSDEEILPDERYSESKHLEGVNGTIIDAYNRIKAAMLQLDPKIIPNPTASYISLKSNRNFAYIQLKKTKMHIIIRLPFETGSIIIQKHKIKQMSERAQEFWNRPCFQVTLDNDANLDEIIKALTEAYKKQVYPMK